MTNDQNKYSCLVDSGAQISTISLEHAKKLGLEIMDSNGNIIKSNSKKKSRCSKLEKRLKKLENRFDTLDDDLSGK
jgi:Aspartyl protease